MNPAQMAQQIKHKLQAVVWPGAGGEQVFGDRGVLVVAGGAPAEDQHPPGFPFALVSIEAGVPDEDHPDLIEQGFSVISVVDVKGDPMGEHAIIGGPTANLAQSPGRGVTEVAARARSAVQDLTGAGGASIILSATGTGGAAKVGRAHHLGMDAFDLTALCTSQAHYAAPEHFGRAGTVWSWEGAHCAARFDFLNYVVVFKDAPAATSPSEGATIYTGTTPTFDSGPVFAGKVYSVFAQYNSRGGATAEGYSQGGLVGSVVTT